MLNAANVFMGTFFVPMRKEAYKSHRIKCFEVPVVVCEGYV